MKTTLEKKLILKILENSESRHTPLALIKTVVNKSNISSISAKNLIKELIAQKEIAYTYFFGSTYIELSFNKPVKITDHFILVPAGIKSTYNKNYINIFLNPGVSFGSGRHPTTRLSLMAIDYTTAKGILDPQKNNSSDSNFIGLDIGTGSGVLAIAAAKTVISNCLALDIDPNSLAEAKNNVALNNMENKITITDIDIFSLKNSFSLIIANLRYPTLKTLAEKITFLSKKGSVLILSGIRKYEKNDLITIYNKKGFTLFFEKDEKNWSCIAMQSGKK